VARREESYEIWGVGEEYSNLVRSTARVETKDLKIRTAYTLQDSLESMLRKFSPSAVVVAVVLLLLGVLYGIGALAGGFGGWLISTAWLGGAAVTLVFNVRSVYRLGRALLVEHKPDAILFDVGRALIAALGDADLVSRTLAPENLRLIEQGDGSYEVSLDHSTPEDAETFVRSYRQIFAPVGDKRYLILRNEDRLPNLALRWLWIPLRRFFRSRSEYPSAYLPVPDLLATRKERAEALARTGNATWAEGS
jgi:hypothetical protein